MPRHGVYRASLATDRWNQQDIQAACLHYSLDRSISLVVRIYKSLNPDFLLNINSMSSELSIIRLMVRLNPNFNALNHFSRIFSVYGDSKLSALIQKLDEPNFKRDLKTWT